MTDDEANELLTSPAADAFAIALDLLGWMIVPQDRSNNRWPMNEPSPDCPPWADAAPSGADAAQASENPDAEMECAIMQGIAERKAEPLPEPTLTPAKRPPCPD
jgi:hypothetical protein